MKDCLSLEVVAKDPVWNCLKIWGLKHPNPAVWLAFPVLWFVKLILQKTCRFFHAHRRLIICSIILIYITVLIELPTSKLDFSACSSTFSLKVFSKLASYQPCLLFAGVEDVSSESVNNSAVSPLNLLCCNNIWSPHFIIFHCFLKSCCGKSVWDWFWWETIRNTGATELISLWVPPSPSASFTH